MEPGTAVKASSTQTSISLSGVLVPAVTPFDPVTGDIDLVALRMNLRRWLEHPVLGIVVGGSTGEAMFLDDDERLASLTATRELLDSDRLMVAGTGAESTRRTIALGQMAADAGADAALVQPPAFYKGAMTPEVVREHYTTVADASPIPVIVYQVPLRFSTLDFPTGLVAELSQHPNIVGIKDSRGNLDLVGELVTQTSSDFQVLVGNGAMLYASLEVGAVGGILGLANMAPKDTSGLPAAFMAGDHSESGRIQKNVAPVHREIVGGFGVPGVKAALDILGYRGGNPRPPLRPLADRDREEIHKIVRAAGLLDVD